MVKTKFYKLATLPGTLEPDSFYFIENGTVAESYVTNSSGQARSIGNTVLINSLIDAKIADLSSLEIVADITARDALTLNANTMVLVLDASADNTVDSGAAMYVYNFNTTAFIKVTEYESLDVIVNWGDIQGRPTSAPGDIDDAVTKRHEHLNKPQLDKIGEDGDGDITYNGNPVQKWNTVNW